MLYKLLNSRLNVRKILIKTFGEKSIPDVTFVVPVYNQEKYIRAHLVAIVKNSNLRHNLIIINDSSSDETHSKIIDFINEIGNSSDPIHSKTIEIAYYRTFWPWFETRYDDFAFRIAKTKYLIEIQADMKILEFGFDLKLVAVMEENNDIFAISGRGIQPHSEMVIWIREGNYSRKQIFTQIYQRLRTYWRTFAFNSELVVLRNAHQTKKYPTGLKTEESLLCTQIFPEEVDFAGNKRAGFLGPLISLIPYDSENLFTKCVREHQNKIWVGDSIMRGPIILNKEFYEQCGGFNISAFFLGYDDSDLFYRASELGFRVAYMPILYSSPLEIGSTRKKRTLISRMFFVLNVISREKEFKLTPLYRLGEI